MSKGNTAWRSVLVWALALMAPSITLAEPTCGPRRHGSRDCPHSEYTRLHYWTPSVYRVRAYLHPSNLDQYPPGPSPSVPATIEITRYKCRSIPPTPSAPYADPASYFGRAITPP